MAAPDAEPVILSERINFVLQESRVLLLGTQVLVGFGYNGFFRPGFEHLQPIQRWLLLAALTLLLIGVALLIANVPLHRIGYDADDDPEMHSRATHLMEGSLLPLAAAIGIDLYVVISHVAGAPVALAASLSAAAVALSLWYLVGLLVRKPEGWMARMEREAPESKPLSQSQHIERLLTEARVVLPGVQALFGFQFAAILTESFERLPWADKLLHLAALLAMMLAMALLMAPAAFHRIATAGHAAPVVLTFGTATVLGAMLPLSLALAADFYVVLHKVSHNPTIAAAGSGTGAVLMLTLWFGVPLIVRQRRRSKSAGMAAASR